MAEPTTTDEALTQAALGPKTVTVGDTSAEAQDVDQIIKVENRQASKTAATKSAFGLRSQVGTPPGCGG